MKRILILITTILALNTLFAQDSYSIALLKYNGGGDWYANPTSLPNLITYCNEQLNTSISPDPATVEVGSPDIFNYPFLHMTGHGNVVFSDQEADNLRAYLTSGGFLHIDDNYGMDPYIRLALKEVFPDIPLVEIPFSHEIYNQQYRFEDGLPKIHEHDEKAPRGYGILIDGRIVLYYTYETDLGDGWEDSSVHNDPNELRELAFKMGANIIQYALSF